MTEVIEKTTLLERSTLLLVEDNGEIHRLIGRMLERAGYRVAVAENGVEALKQLERLRPDLVLMDLDMPVMDGYTATRRIRKTGFKAPILALTSASASGNMQKALQGGFNGFVQKPVTLDQLLLTIKRYLPAS